jgi:hypothetical protein
MERRTILQIGVAAALPAAAQQQPHPEPVSQPPDRPDWKPQVFDDHQDRTVIALTDLIIPDTDTPGAKAANVHRYIDLFLHDGPDSDRVRFLEGLAWLDGYAIQKHGHPFVSCAPADQVAILSTLDTGTGPARAFFRMAKGLTARIYYSTRIGYQELNKGGRVPATFGCRHPEHG